ncbi:MAG: hypothetical protein JWN17_2671, partial [Frankiales bacterium]|nr:hypothetical protein [Frankiales bacterium]
MRGAALVLGLAAGVLTPLAVLATQTPSPHSSALSTPDVRSAPAVRTTPTTTPAAPTPPPSGNPRVVQGGARYLFIAQDWTVPCQDTGQAVRVARNARALAAALEQGGRPAVVTIGPDKSTVVARQVPATVPEQRCAEASRAAVWRELTRSAGPSFLDLRPALTTADRSVQTYWRKDTHWTPSAGAVYARALAQRFDPALAARLTTRSGTATRHGDLARVLSRDDAETVRTRELVNPDVRVEELPRQDIGMGQGARRTRAVPGPTGRVVPGLTVLVGDSFDDTAVEQLAPLFEQALFFWPGLQNSSLPTIMKQVARADRVVVETVERFDQRYRMFDDAAVQAAR